MQPAQEPWQVLIMIAAMSVGIIITRFVPFILFPDKKEPPKVVLYLGKLLPAAMMGLLVVYCLKGVNVFAGSHGLPELISILFIIGIHQWRHNTLLSIGGGTVLYMVLVQLVF